MILLKSLHNTLWFTATTAEMQPDTLVSPETAQSCKMLAVLRGWDEKSGSYTDNAVDYVILMLFKLLLDGAVFLVCCRKMYACFLNMFGLSIIIADAAMTLCMAVLWFFRIDSSAQTSCFFLSRTSAAFSVLPLPIICLGLVDYCLADTRSTNFCKPLMNALLTLLVWMFAAFYSFSGAKVPLTHLQYPTGKLAIACEIKESSIITCLTLGILGTVALMIVPFASNLPLWIKEADRLADLREKQGDHRSDLFSSNPSTDSKNPEENPLKQTRWPRPPLFVSLTLGFAVFWMPYLIVSMSCAVFSFGVPAYITVNLLWLECINSLLVGAVFWVKSGSQGPYCHLPENVCCWKVYWHLSEGTWQQSLPVAVFNPSHEEKKSLMYV